MQNPIRMNIAIGILLALHAIAHLAGFVGAFRLVATVPHQTELLLGRIDLSETAARVGGVGWVLAAAGFAVASAGAFASAVWWPRMVVAATLASLAMCILYLPLTRIGLAINAGLLGVFVVGRAALWLLLRD
jgi:hypothetical protein